MNTSLTRPHRHTISLDERGRGLVVTIRIGSDGRVYFHDIPADMLPVARAMAPGDTTLAHRAAIAEGFELGSARDDGAGDRRQDS